MSGEKNLIPFSRRSKEEARSYGRIGGVASGESRRRKKQIRQTLEMLLETAASEEVRVRVSGLLKNPSKVKTVQDAVLAGLLIRAIESGDPQAVSLILKMTGEADAGTNDEVVIIDDIQVD